MACALHHWHHGHPSPAVAALATTPPLRTIKNHYQYKNSSYCSIGIVSIRECRQTSSSLHSNRCDVARFRCISDASARINDECGDDNEPPSSSMIHDPPPHHRRRRTLNYYGRAHRKTKSRQRKIDAIASENDDSEYGSDEDEPTIAHRTTTTTTTPRPPVGYTLPNGEFVFGSREFGNPIRDRYIRSLQKINYPNTVGGWKTVFQKSWEKYLWTFEGFLLKEKKRDVNGNIIVPQQGQGINANDNDDDEEKEEEADRKGLRDQVTDAAQGIAKNVQKNIATLQQETPQLIEMGQRMTGVSTKEELRAWVGDQLKLGTACLNEFMAGYRKGRDVEIDRMLHDYFSELEEDKSKVESVGAEERKGDEVDEQRLEQANNELRNRGREKRAWGRSERRRLKRESNRTS